MPSKRIEPERRAQVARDQVEGRALARAVRADEAKDFALAHFEGHLIDRQESSEALGKPLDCQASSTTWRRSTTSAAAAPAVLRLNIGRIHDRDVLAGILHDDRRRALVLPGHRGPGREELHAVALDGAAGRNIDVERGLAHRLGVEAAVFLLGDRQDVVEQDPGLVEPHRAMRRHVVRLGLGLVAIDHDLDEIADPGRELLGIEKLRRHRIDVAEIVDVLAEGRAQLVELAVTGAVADQHLEVQAAFARLAQEQRDVGVVAGVRDHVGAARA